jgi:hypothetical protein
MPWVWQVSLALEVTVLEAAPDAPEGKTRVEAKLDGNVLPEFWLSQDVRNTTAEILKSAIGVAVGEILADALRDPEAP